MLSKNKTKKTLECEKENKRKKNKQSIYWVVAKDVSIAVCEFYEFQHTSFNNLHLQWWQTLLHEWYKRTILSAFT